MTVRFHSQIANGAIIIPAELRSELEDNMAVEVEVSSTAAFDPGDYVKAKDYINYLMDHPLKVARSIPILSRDEIYDRRN